VLSIVADIGWKNYGSPDPLLTYKLVGWIPAGGTSMTGSLTRSAGENAGVYLIKQGTLSAGNNYLVNFTGANFYINPFGKGTKKIRSYLNCISDNGNGTLTANFGYINDNAVKVYIPIGENNYISPADAIDPSTVQPVLFLPGSHDFKIIFDKTRNITWTVSSNESDHKTSTTTGANLGSPKCTSKSAVIGNENVSKTDIPEFQYKELKAYPNPTRDRITLNFREEPGLNEITVVDVLGRTYRVNKQWVPAQGLEIDLSGVPTGIYLIKINSTSTTKSFSIIKQ